MASTQETSGLLSPNEKVPVQCLDNPFGFNAVVIYEDKSFPLNQCTPFWTNSGVQQMPNLYSNERSNAEANDCPESGHRMQIMSGANSREHLNTTSHPVWPEVTNPDNNLNFTDGGSPLTMAAGGMGNYKPQQMESLVQLEEEEWDKPKNKKRREKRRKKNRRKQR